MAKVIANELERFRQDIRDIEQKIHSMEETGRSMFEEVQALTGMWEGSAHDTYLTQFQVDSENIKLAIQNLKEYKKSMEEAYRKYQTCERQVAETIKQVRI